LDGCTLHGKMKGDRDLTGIFAKEAALGEGVISGERPSRAWER
jgi:hypothetical protein